MTVAIMLGSTGWHSHPGPVLVTVKSGALRLIYADDASCAGTVYEAGDSFIDRGDAITHIACNVSATDNVELWATYLVPRYSCHHRVQDRRLTRTQQLLSERAEAKATPRTPSAPSVVSASHRFGERLLSSSIARLEEEIMIVALEGGCACGAVRYRLTSDPMFVHCCHCLNCQRQTGSAFVINLLIETERVELLAGDPQPVDVPRDDGSAQRIFRCPSCQVAVFSQYTRPEFRYVRAGTLDDPSSVEPDVHIFTRSKVPWVTLPESVPAFEIYYDADELWPAASLERLEAVLASVDSAS